MLSENYIDRKEVLDNAYEQGFNDAALGKTLFECPYTNKELEKRSQWLLGLMTGEAREGRQSAVDRP